MDIRDTYYDMTGDYEVFVNDLNKTNAGIEEGILRQKMRRSGYNPTGLTFSELQKFVNTKGL